MISVPRSLADAEASIGNNKPRIMMPKMAMTFVVDIQNSISPYFRTLKRLKTTIVSPKMLIQTAGLVCVFGIQNDIELAIVTNFAGTPRNSLMSAHKPQP